MALTDELAFFSLQDRVLSPAYTPAEGTSGLHVGFTPLPELKAGTPLCPSSADNVKEWDNLAWVLDLTEMHPQGTKATIIGNYSSYLSGTVKLRQGFVEREGVPKTLLKPQIIYGWELLSGTNKKRALKETVRYATHPTNQLVLSTNKNESIKLDLTKADLVLRVSHLPLHLPTDPLDDLRAYYALVERTAWPTQTETQLPIPSGREKCGVAATSDCGCCPSVRFVDPNLA